MAGFKESILDRDEPIGPIRYFRDLLEESHQTHPVVFSYNEANSFISTVERVVRIRDKLKSVFQVRLN